MYSRHDVWREVGDSMAVPTDASYMATMEEEDSPSSFSCATMLFVQSLLLRCSWR